MRRSADTETHGPHNQREVAEFSTAGSSTTRSCQIARIPRFGRHNRAHLAGLISSSPRAATGQSGTIGWADEHIEAVRAFTAGMSRSIANFKLRADHAPQGLAAVASGLAVLLLCGSLLMQEKSHTSRLLLSSAAGRHPDAPINRRRVRSHFCRPPPLLQCSQPGFASSYAVRPNLRHPSLP